MANSAQYTLNDTTPVLIFSGVGNVVIRVVAGNAYFGGPSVSASTGLVDSGMPLALNVNSPDEIWAIAATGQSPVATVLEVR